MSKTPDDEGDGTDYAIRAEADKKLQDADATQFGE